jgi:hypothetical protein
MTRLGVGGFGRAKFELVIDVKTAKTLGLSNSVSFDCISLQGDRAQCLLLGVKRTSSRPHGMSAYDPKRTLAANLSRCKRHSLPHSVDPKSLL